MGYRLTIYFSDGHYEEVDEIFDTEQAALDEYNEWLEGWDEGGDVLQLAGENYSSASIESYEIEEV